MFKGIGLSLAFGAWITAWCIVGYYGAIAICETIDKVLDKV